MNREERSELERLRAENSELRRRAALSAPAAPAGRQSGWRSRWRTPTAAVLIVTGCLLAPLCVLAIWTANQISGAIAGFIHGQVARLVASPAAADLWVRVNRTAHAAIVQVLSGQRGGTISNSNGQVVIDLSPLIDNLKETLSAQGFTLVDRSPLRLCMRQTPPGVTRTGWCRSICRPESTTV